VVVVGDHGESLGEHGIFYDHVGIYETQVRVPFIVRVPGFPPGLDAEHSVTHLDIAPTIAELFALELEAGPGSSLVPSLRGERDGPAAPDEVLIQETSANRQVAVRRGGWKLIWPIASAHVLSDVPELYDLDSDPDETRNLAREHPARVAELKRHVEPWIRLGFVEPFADLDPESLDALRSLGYVR
jgi:arylsulfatase A-like enzyme